MSKIPSVPDLPELPSGATLDQVVAWLQALRTQNLAREPVSVGDKLLKFVTRQELVSQKILAYANGVVSAGTGVGTGGAGGTGGTGGAYVPDLTPPASITGLTVTGLLTHFFVEFDAPAYPQGHGNGYTSIYAANWSGTGALPTFADAVEVYQVSGAATIAIIPAQPGQTTCFWAGAVTTDGVRQVDGAGPTGGLHGVHDETGQDVSSLLNVLNGQITETQLYAALGSRIDLIDAASTTPGSVNARVSAEASTRQGADNSLFAQYTVKLDVNGYVSGFGLASTLSNATPYSMMIIRADSFSIASPSGPGIAPMTPFVVITTPTTINGVAVPVGIYADAAFFLNGSITNAKIGNAAIDDAKIANLSAGKLTAGSIAVGEYIQSTGYSTGSAGWRITGNGVAEFAAASIRGQLLASQIGAGQIDASKLNVTTLSSVTATIGTLRTTSSGARVEIKDNKIGVFDSANVLRVRIGDLSGTF